MFYLRTSEQFHEETIHHEVKPVKVRLIHGARF